MYTLWFALFAASVLTECMSQEQPISPAAYQEIAKQGFATNYFKANNGPAVKYRSQNIEDIFN